VNGRCATLPAVSDVAPPPRRGGAEPAPAFTADDLADATGGRLVSRSPRPIRGAAVDSRIVAPGELFVALPGERTDGHRFLGQAIAAGAAALVVTRPPDDSSWPDDVTVLQVADGLVALHAIAASWRARFSPEVVVGVTGSIAKTSTKEAISTVLGVRFRTLKNEGNLNNEIGLPLTVLRLAPEHEAAVFEMGMYVGGEIRDLARIGRPRIGVVTAVQPVHLSRIGSIEAIADAKAELVEELPPSSEGGIAVLNTDDERVRRMAGRTTARVIGYGFGHGADVTASGIESAGAEGMAFVLRTPSGEHPIRVPVLGRLSVHNALAAAAVGDAAGLSLAEIGDGLAAGWGAPHRAQPIRLGEVTIVDDSYNASPGSVTAALELLAGLPGRRIAVLGEMLELGADSEAGHRAVGTSAASLVDQLIVVGEGARPIADAARSAGLPGDAVVSVIDRDQARDVLLERLTPGDVVLVKASRGIELDRLVDDLVAALEPRPR
jgi:UDP-N-acetylmuramoyl-tripeptide--D-alanyl-D-alanine ligase